MTVRLVETDSGAQYQCDCCGVHLEYGASLDAHQKLCSCLDNEAPWEDGPSYR
jgi:hypothetical protein